MEELVMAPRNELYLDLVSVQEIRIMIRVIEHGHVSLERFLIPGTNEVRAKKWLHGINETEKSYE